ncbi:MAG TPA: type II secretion system protein GspC [Cellvibrio sp.]|uniref:type II secretion system protein GspC n=1 Tax=Cellvibrio sp. TaxID=1965322 RepID=UPI000EB9406C|nr:type II secretion system protein GspC [Cellvibrio sp.]HCS64851.1 type II secretion system protein GspC [Cellvibrio sp.]
MQDRSLNHRAAFEQRTAQLEVQLRRFFALLNRVSLQRWQWLVMLLLVIWLSHSLARLFWLVIPSPVIPPATLTLVAADSQPSATADVVNITQIKTLTPFGDSVQEIAPPVEAQATAQGIENDATDTQLNLILRGLLGSTDDKAGRAIIASGERADVYAVGDTLPVGTNVTLAKVLDVRVIINNNGAFESLWLFKEDPNAPKLTTSFAAPQASGDPTQGGYANPPFQQQPPLYVDKSPMADSPRFGADPAASAASKSLADVVAMSIYREGGQVVGYKIRPGRNAEMFSSLGLQTDDIVTAVNGVPLSSPGKIMEIYKSMGSATSANLEIRRGGSTVNLDVMLK